MAGKLIATIQRWIGLSTDTKPTGVAVGSTFLEYDTAIRYITYDGTNWTKYEFVLGQINTAISRDMPYLTEFWESEALTAAVWEETLDGVGTGAFGTAGGYMYYDLDTEAVADSDVILNSKFRWQIKPGIFGDSNNMIERFVLEFEAQAVTAITSHDNTNFFLGLSSAKSNDIAQQNLAGFFLDSDVLKGKCDKAGTETGGITGAITATLTNWNKFKIIIEDGSITFSLNGSDETALINAASQPDVAMYIIFGTRAEAGAAVGLNIGNVRAYYEEVI